MSDSNKRRTNSFRKLFPSLFFSNKSKEKPNKRSQMGYKKSSLDNSSNSNQYENPRTVKENVSYTNNDISRIYENLAIGQYRNDIDSSCHTVSSEHSSSSTLVSESGKPQLNRSEDNSDLSKQFDRARPQVPPKPYNELNNTPNTVVYSDRTQFPDVYYHSVEKITETIAPLDEIQVYKAVQSHAKPASVGAEIKKVSTKFLISPKKEAEVRTIQPKRARSFSFDNNNKKTSTLQENHSQSSKKPEENITKSYNYSAPTSPIPTYHRIPNMPKTVSPYGHVKKSMNEAEERRNSLNRTGLQKTHQIPKMPVAIKETNTTPKTHISLERTEQKAKARQKLEAFYWQKLKELKQKEDEYLLEQSLNSTLKRSTLKSATSYSNSNSSLPRSYKTNSLPRESEFRGNMGESNTLSTTFSRGGVERRTDSFLRQKSTHNDVDIVYRHPEKLQTTYNKNICFRDSPQSQGYQRGPLEQDSRSFSLQPKRVSFEEQIYDTNPKYTRQDKIFPSKETSRIDARSKGMLSSPPRPPVRTTSVGTSNIVNNHRINPSAHYSLYSESESGSEASEIQRILRSHTQKEEDVEDLPSDVESDFEDDDSESDSD